MRPDLQSPTVATPSQSDVTFVDATTFDPGDDYCPNPRLTSNSGRLGKSLRSSPLVEFRGYTSPGPQTTRPCPDLTRNTVTRGLEGPRPIKTLRTRLIHESGESGEGE